MTLALIVLIALGLLTVLGGILLLRRSERRYQAELHDYYERQRKNAAG